MRNTLKTLALFIGSSGFLPTFYLISVLWIGLNAKGIIHFDPPPYPLLIIFLVFLAVCFLSLAMHQINRNIDLTYQLYGAHSKTWDKVDAARIEQEEQLLKIASKIAEFQEDHGRLVEIVFELRNAFVASKHQNTTINERVILVAKEVEKQEESIKEIYTLLQRRGR
jgi:uncharacterized membrane protein